MLRNVRRAVGECQKREANTLDNGARGGRSVFTRRSRLRLSHDAPVCTARSYVQVCVSVIASMSTENVKLLDEQRSQVSVVFRLSLYDRLASR